jgi:outer membrane protein assembly factor BamB
MSSIMRSILSWAIVLMPFTLAAAGENWPQFRGPEGNGVSDSRGLPLRWSESKNIKWKTAIHGRAWSSPVIWGDQVWLTTATDDGIELYAVCVDRGTGKVLRDIRLFRNEQPPFVAPMNSYASPTPIIEKGRFYASFGSFGTACVDTKSGETIWSRRDFPCDHAVGPGSSPAMAGDLLVLQMDGRDTQYVIALDKKTGEPVWKTKRSTDYGDRGVEFRKAFCTPLVIEFAGRRQVVSTGAVETISYDPASGKELWKVRPDVNSYSNTSRPLFCFGLVLVNTGASMQIWAVRPDGHGDVTGSHVAWKIEKNVPFMPSPTIVGDLIFMINDSGIISCFEAKTGKNVWRHRLGGNFEASPIAADGRVYFFSDDGPVTVIAAGRKYKELAVNKLDQGFLASPAVAGKAIFLRTKSHLYRIEECE